VNYLVGLTGGIGSGKTTVAGMFSAAGVRIVDTDLISHQLTKTGGDGIAPIRAAFGDAFVSADGALDRKQMRDLVFADPAAKQKLESILHPLILAHAKAEAAAPTAAPYTLVVVPLLFESGCYADWMARTIAVDCPEQLQIARTMQRSQLDESQVRAILAQQISRAERLRLADEVIRNDGSLDSLKTQVVGMHRRLSALAAKSD